MSKPLVALMSIMLAVVGLTGAAAAAPRSPAFTGLCGAMAGSAPSRVKHVMFILEENRSYRQVIGDAAALGDPYINGVLVPSCGLAANFHNFSHPSLPNYLALTSGKAAGTGTDTDCSKVANCPQPQSSIFSQLGNAGRSWREYAASMPANCYPSNSGKYLVRHAPPPYYTSSPVPDQHGQLVVFITWDEGEGTDKVAGEHCWDSAHAHSSAYPSCWVATLVLSPYTKPGTRSWAYFNDRGLLGTAEDMLGLPRLAATSGYTSLRTAFGL